MNRLFDSKIWMEISDAQPTVFKVLLLGNSCVGKTVLFNRLIGKEQYAGTTPTVAGQWGRVNWETEDNNVDIILWDTAGQEKYKSLTPIYYRQAKAALLVYDVTDPLSEEGIDYYYENLTRELDQPPVVIIVGNKIDLRVDGDDTASNTARMIKKASDLQVELREISALENIGIDDLMELLAKRLSEYSSLHSTSEVSKTDITARRVKRNACCN